MLLARVQDQLACLTAKAAVESRWSCVSTPVDAASEGRGYAMTGTTAAFGKQFAHRGSASSLCVRIPARLGNPEDNP